MNKSTKKEICCHFHVVPNIWKDTVIVHLFEIFNLKTL